MHREEGLAGANRLADLHVQVDPSGVVNRVFLAGPACAKAPRRDSVRQRRLVHEDAVAISDDGVRFRGDRQRSIVVAALRSLADEGTIPMAKVAEAIKKYGIKTDKINPLYA